MQFVQTLTFLSLAGLFSVASFGILRMLMPNTRRAIKRRVSDWDEVLPGEVKRQPFYESIANLLTKAFPRPQNKSEDLNSRLRLAGFLSGRAYALYQITRIAASLSIGGLVCFSMSFATQCSLQVVITCVFMGIGVGFLIPNFALESFRRKRYRQIFVELPDLSDLLVVCMNAGLSLEASVRFVVDEFAQNRSVLNNELQIVRHDMSLGLSVDEAFARFSARCKHDAVGLLSTFMKESRKMGMPISDAIKRHSESIRTQVELEAEERSQKAAVQMMIPTLLLIMPATFVVLAGPAVLLIQEAFAGK